VFNEPENLPTQRDSPAMTARRLDLLPPADLDLPLWKSLMGNLRDTVAPQRLPPLRLTSRPIDIGVLPADRLNLPWYRSIFSNVGDVLAPENLPLLELESRPVDVGELIGDQMSRMWWTSLLRNLADTVAPEREPALQLTSAAFEDPTFVSGSMLLPRWSSVIEGPKIFLPDKPRTPYSVPMPPPKMKLDPVEVEFVQVLRDEMGELKSDLRRSRLRARLWIGFVTAEFAFLISSMFWR
jgi:hypothetical protein